MEYTLKDILDVSKLQELLDSLDDVHSLPSAVIDTEGNILTATAWQDICTKFHRVNPSTEKKCIESDMHIGTRLAEKTPHIIYRCPMGLVDTATPIIIEGKHLGNVFTGQLYIDPPDETYFKEQARQFGFDETEYLDAMHKVPVFSEEQLHKNLTFIAKLALMLAEQGIQEIRKNEALVALQKSEEFSRRIIASSNDCIKVLDIGGHLLSLSEGGQKLLEIDDIQPYLGLSWTDFWKEDKEGAQQIIEKAANGEVGIFYGYCETVKGTPKWWEVVVSPVIGADNKIENLLAVSRDITERSLAEEALKQSEYFFKESQRSASIGSYYADFIANRWDSSEVLDTIFGIDNDYVRSIQGWLNIVHPDDRDFMDRYLIEEVISNQKPFSMEYRIIRQNDGETRWVNGRGSAKFDNDGNMLSLMGTIQDITEHKKTDEELKNLSLRLDIATSSANLGVWNWDVRNNHMIWDDRMFELYGITRETFPNTIDAWLNGLHPEDKESAIAASQAALKENKKFDTSFRICHPDGTVKYIRATGLVIKEADGTAERMIGMNADITRRKLAEITNERFLLRQRAILDNLPMMAWLKDTESRLEMVNESYAKACGCYVEECIGKTDMELFPHEMAKKFIEDDREVCVSGQKKQVEESISTQDGEKWHLTFKTPIFDEQGQVIGTTGIAQDITSLKEAEKQRLKLETQIQQTQKMESVGRLAGGVAHDFNNMLTVILGHAELGLMHLDPSHPVHSDLKEIRNTAERSADLTRQLLAFARKQTVVPKVIDLNETVEGMLKMLRRLIGEDIHLIWRPAETLWSVKMDSSQLDQIMANLCVNARDAIADVGKITIETENCMLDENYCISHVGVLPGKYVKLSVSDDGSGIDKETLSNIFEPFYTTKELGKGTGLGLSTVYGAVKQNNGYIDVYSEPEIGTTFSIYLPCYKDKGGQAIKEDTTEPQHKGHETILLVEDEPCILKMAAKILKSLGYNVLAASTPDEALKLARDLNGEIHLLVTDVVMPEMNGRDLSDKLLSLRPDIKSLFMSGYTADVIAHHGVLGEDVHFIQKPFAMNALSAKLREVLDS